MLIYLFLFSIFFQGKSPTSVRGRVASGVLPAPTSWHVITGSTRGPSPSSAASVTAVFPARTTWRCTWSDTSDNKHTFPSPTPTTFFLHRRFFVWTFFIRTFLCALGVSDTSTFPFCMPDALWKKDCTLYGWLGRPVRR